MDGFPVVNAYLTLVMSQSLEQHFKVCIVYRMAQLLNLFFKAPLPGIVLIDVLASSAVMQSVL